MTQVRDHHDHLLVAVNELPNDESVKQAEALIANGNKLFIDSGVYSLTTSHAKAHGMTMDQVLSMPPEEVDGFDKLFGRYLAICKQLGDKAWGYIEVDIGGKEHKRRMRARIEAMGLKPIPVYHPLVDGWDYFDELAQNYDRICFGNIVAANSGTRKRLMATCYERMRKYPKLWVHLLGMTPNQWACAYPVSSCDSSSWLSLVRWPKAFRALSQLRYMSAMGKPWWFTQGADDPEKNFMKATYLGAYDAHFIGANWHAAMRDIERYQKRT